MRSGGPIVLWCCVFFFFPPEIVLSFQFPALLTAVLSFQHALAPLALRRWRFFPVSFLVATYTAAFASLRSINPWWSWSHSVIHALARATNSVCDTAHRQRQPAPVTARSAASPTAPAIAELALSFSLQNFPPFVHTAIACTRHFLDFHFCPCLWAMATKSSATSSKDGPKTVPPTFTSNVVLSTDKLDGSNYDSWAFDIKLWLTGQDYANHLTKKVDDVPAADCPRWTRIHA